MKKKSVALNLSSSRKRKKALSPAEERAKRVIEAIKKDSGRSVMCILDDLAQSWPRMR